MHVAAATPGDGWRIDRHLTHGAVRRYSVEMPEGAGTIEAGRLAYAAADWSSAYAQLNALRATLDVDDLALLARSAWFLAQVRESIELSEEVFRRYRDDDRLAAAAETALLLSLLWFARGSMSVMSGWMSRARTLLATLPDGPGHGYLAYLDGMYEVLVEGRPAPTSLVRLQELARTLRDPALDALGLTIAGVTDLRHGEVARGFARLDEAMLPVIAGQVPAEWGGDIYCTVIHVCHELADFQRMADWTSATERWCTQFASEAIYPGICRVHRLELRGAHGEWDDAEAQLATESRALLDGNAWVAGEGFYQLGEILRRRGDHRGALEAYAATRAAGIDPQPGEALLAFTEGRASEAWGMLTASLQGRDRVARVRLLRAGVEVALATGRMPDAAALAGELREAAADYRSRGFLAWSAHADGMLALGQGRPAEALTSLQEAATLLRRDRQPYETARVLEWIAQAHEADGRPGAAQRARAEAAETFARLGVRPPPAPAAGNGPLTAREAEVLECVAAGASNRDVAARLFISEKTVGRHLANIYVKLGVGSRTAAAAWWREQGGPASGSA